MFSEVPSISSAYLTFAPVSPQATDEEPRLEGSQQQDAPHEAVGLRLSPAACKLIHPAPHRACHTGQALASCSAVDVRCSLNRNLMLYDFQVNMDSAQDLVCLE